LLLCSKAYELTHFNIGQRGFVDWAEFRHP